MALTVLSPLDPSISHEIRAFDQSRIEEIDRKHKLLVEYMHLQGLDALLLQTPEMFSWLTGGASNQRLSGRTHAALLITPDARVVLANQIDSPQLFDRELNGLGFLLKERPWTEDPEAIRMDCIRGRQVACDMLWPETRCAARDLLDFRLRLNTREQNVLRELGRQVAHAVEATARSLQRGETEFEISGQLSHRLYRHGVTPVLVQAWADGQGHRYRHWTAGADPVERTCVLAAVGRREGLHVGCSRTIYFGAPSAEVQDTFDVATLVFTTGLHFSKPGWSIQEAWQRVARIYEKFGVPEEWRQADQADFLGYSPAEERWLPDSNRELPSDCAIHWHPSVRSALVGDSMLLNPHQSEVLTPHENWPGVMVRVRDVAHECPGILIRE